MINIYAVINNKFIHCNKKNTKFFVTYLRILLSLLSLVKLYKKITNYLFVNICNKLFYLF